MVVELDDGSGIVEKSIDSKRAQTFCLTDELAILIASIGAAVF